MPCTYNLFKSISHPLKKQQQQQIKKDKQNGHPLFGLSSEVFTFDSLFTYRPYRSDFLNSLATVLTEWPEDHKNRCLSSSVGLHFREREEKINEKSKNTKTENVRNGKEKYGGEKTRVRAHLGQKLKNTTNSSNFSLNLL